MTFEELKDHLQETLTSTQKTELILKKWRSKAYRAKMAEIRRRGEESHRRLRKSYNRFMRRHGGQQPPAA
jgi:hypothetical protein